jgi:glucose/mannose transport system permease protein
MRIHRVVLHVILCAAAGVFLFPLLVAVLTSIKPLGEIRDGSIFGLPQAPTLAAWSKAWASACIGTRCTGISAGFASSLSIVLPAVFGSCILGAITGFALSLKRSRPADLLLLTLIVSLFVPAQVILYPLIVVERELTIYGTRTGVIVADVIWSLPFVTLLFRNFFLSLPREIVAAASIDGAGFFTILFRVLLPLSVPAYAVALALQFTFLWNEFLFGLMLSAADKQPMTVMLNVLAGPEFGTLEYNVNMAAAMEAAVPTIAVYLLAGRLLARSISGRLSNG